MSRVQLACLPTLSRSHWWLDRKPNWNNSFQISIYSVWSQKFCGGVGADQWTHQKKSKWGKSWHRRKREGAPMDPWHLCRRPSRQRELGGVPWLGIQKGIAWLQQKIWDVVCTLHLWKCYGNLLIMHLDLPLWVEEMCLFFVLVFFSFTFACQAQIFPRGQRQVVHKSRPALFDSVWKAVRLGSHAYVGLPPLPASSR